MPFTLRQKLAKPLASVYNLGRNHFALAGATHNRCRVYPIHTIGRQNFRDFECHNSFQSSRLDGYFAAIFAIAAATAASTRALTSGLFMLTVGTAAFGSTLAATLTYLRLTAVPVLLPSS